MTSVYQRYLYTNRNHYPKIMAKDFDLAFASNQIDGLSVSVENIGGIDSCEVEFDPGITILAGRNATNRTSLLRAVAEAFGGNVATLKSDAEAGRIELTVGDETYTQTYERKGETVRKSGDAYSEGDIIDLFGCLISDNPARQAIERGENLREIIMRPVDRAKVHRQISDLKAERDRIQGRIEEIERELDRLPDLEERRAEIEADIKSVKAELEQVREELEEYDADEEEAEKAGNLVSELESLHEECRVIEADINTQEASLEELRSDRKSAEAKLDEVTVREGELDDLEQEIDHLEKRHRSLSGTVNDLIAIVDFNEDIVSGTVDFPEPKSGESDVTAALDPGSETVRCWSCGSHVERNDIADRLEELRTIVQEKRDERKRVKEEKAELQQRRDDLREDVDRRTELQRRIEDLERELERREERITELESERHRIQSEIEDLEECVEETVQLRENDVVAKHQDLSSLEYERGQLEEKLADIDEEIEAIDDLDDEREQLAKQREEVQEDLTRLRSRIEDLERNAVEQFNDHMDEVLDLLGYGNIARVWIENKAESDRRAEDSTFELHVIRESSDGAMYEDVVANLSESEREVIGLVVALAGYLIHDLHELVPVMMLDSLEALDSDRIAALVEYFADYPVFLLVALLPEDERALPDDYNRLPVEELSS